MENIFTKCHEINSENSKQTQALLQTDVEFVLTSKILFNQGTKKD